MEHREAREHLLDLEAGELDGVTRDELQRHIAGCEDCRAWLVARDLLGDAFAATPGLDHVDSRLLALCAVRSEEQFEPGRTELRRHLETCDRCRRDMDLVRAAVVESRPGTAPSTVPDRPIVVSPRWMYAVAAGLAAFAVGTMLISGVRRPPPHGAEPSAAASTAAGNAVEASLDATSEVFPDAEIEGTRLIESQGGLMMFGTKIKGGADVTIRAGESVAFGNGFEIGPRARVAVERSPATAAPETGEARDG